MRRENDHTSTALQTPGMEQQWRGQIIADFFNTDAADAGMLWHACKMSRASRIRLRNTASDSAPGGVFDSGSLRKRAS
ncbi:MAG TPA: hypothetical protein VJN91_00935, partial [Gammaproteobacteria bacterium]|nr:hypothetical protein [Gammaproteobacteria bacterium]